MQFSNEVAQRVEELLRDQLRELGVDPTTLPPHEISTNMNCDVWPDKTMVYSWKEVPILRVTPEQKDDGSVSWRMFTGEEVEGSLQ
ncbi:MAG: hypothetical protein R3Y11_03465 [Pseudomonadota bacterium]